jgi:hypothetical protein
MSTQMDLKIKCFEYLIVKFIEWHHVERPHEDPLLSFSKLKVFKLHFFASAVNADKNHKGLLNVFDKFYALPYGHVESDIYNHLDKLTIFSFNGNSLERKTEENHTYFNSINIYKQELDSSIDSLKIKNADLILYKALDLVELSHKWYSWRVNFNLARSTKRYSHAISTEIIQNEIKYFSL